METHTQYVTYRHLEPAWWIIIPEALGLLILIGLALWFLGMKLPQFRVRTLVLLTAIMGVVFVACAKWPVVDAAPPQPANWGLRVSNADGTRVIPAIKRPPTFGECAIRASIAAGVLLAVFMLIGAWRARNAKAVAADVPTRPAA